MRIAPTGHWTHTSRNRRRVPLYFDAGLAAGLVSFLRDSHAASVIDLGCGDGRYVFHLSAAGFDALGIDGNPQTATIPLCRVADLTRLLSRRIVRDWVLCLEVAEHIPARWESVLLRNLHRSNRAGIVISWARRGQRGKGHVNCRDPEEVRSLFEPLGYSVDDAASTALQTAAELPWLRQNLQVFRKGARLPPG